MKCSILFFCLIGCVSSLATELPWIPKTTWVFAVGVLQFDDPKLASWPSQGREDAVMIDSFRRRGVPENQILFLQNKAATRAQISQKFPEFLSHTAAGDTLIFYYAGHGARDYQSPNRPVNFLTYDTQSIWTVQEIVTTIKTNFKGARAWLLADCCHSGALADELENYQGKIEFAALTSAQASATSTGNWTFTECIDDILNGAPQVESKVNGQITLAMAASYCDHQMAFAECQRVRFLTTSRDLLGLSIAQSQGTPSAHSSEYWEGLDEGTWWKVRIMDEKDDRFGVHWIGWDRSHDSWIPRNHLRLYQPQTLSVGTAVNILWGESWYPGNILRNELGVNEVHYDGYPSVDDEWVSRDRLKVRNQPR